MSPDCLCGHDGSRHPNGYCDDCKCLDFTDAQGHWGVRFADLLAVLKAENHREALSPPRLPEEVPFCPVCLDNWPCPAARAISKAEGREG